MSLATAEAIRDRILALIESITPTSLERDKFRRYRNEGDANFEEWAEKNPTAALRRVQVRETGDDEAPLVSSLAQEDVRAQFELRIAYPQSHRYGAQNAMDRYDTIKADWKLLKYNLCGTGGAARGNFSGSHDCTPLPATMTRETGAGVDYLVATLVVEYTRSTT